MIGLRVRKTFDELQQKMTEEPDEAEQDFQTRSKIEYMEQSNIRSELRQLQVNMDNLGRVSIPHSSEDIQGEALSNLLLGSHALQSNQPEEREKFGKVSEGSVKQEVAQGALLCKVKNLLE